MRVKILVGLISILLLLTACQIPQYTQPTTEGGEDISKEIEELTKDVEIQDKEMTPEEKAREEFKQRLLEKQREAREEALKKAAEARQQAGQELPADLPVAEQPVAEEPVVEQPVVEEKVEEPVVEAPKEEAAPVESSTPTRDSSGKLKLTVKEGGLIALKLKATDPDGDKLTYTFASPLDSEGKWQTKVGDAGEYTVKLSLTDGKDTVEDTLYITVLKVNNAPVVEDIPAVTVKEGETVVLTVKATDADGDELSYSYSGFMTAPTYTTDYDDAGEHTVTVKVSDGKETVSKTVTVTVTDLNRPPSFTFE